MANIKDALSQSGSRYRLTCCGVRSLNYNASLEIWCQDFRFHIADMLDRRVRVHIAGDQITKVRQNGDCRQLWGEWKRGDKI